MRKVLILLLAVFCLHSVYADKSDKLNVYVSIMPQKFFAEKVGGGLVNVSVLVPSGTSPENFDPSPKQIVQLGSADVYFTIDIPFENIFLDKLKAGKKKLVVADCDKDVPKFRNQEHEEHEEHGHEHGHHHHGEFDPHIWTDPELIKIIARNMADTLSSIDPAHAATYAANLASFKEELEALKNSYESGLLTEDELQSRVEIQYDRINEVLALCKEEKIIEPFLYRASAPQGFSGNSKWTGILSFSRVGMSNSLLLG